MAIYQKRPIAVKYKGKVLETTGDFTITPSKEQNTPEALNSRNSYNTITYELGKISGVIKLTADFDVQELISTKEVEVQILIGDGHICTMRDGVPTGNSGEISAKDGNVNVEWTSSYCVIK